MAGLLFVYTRSSIHAAKRNAERHRAADGGQISWYNESQRRHGALEKPEELDLTKQLVADRQDKTGKVVVKGIRQSPEEEVLRARKGKRDNGGWCDLLSFRANLLLHGEWRWTDHSQHEYQARRARVLTRSSQICPSVPKAGCGHSTTFCQWRWCSGKETRGRSLKWIDTEEISRRSRLSPAEQIREY